jgi:hypothetical protein
MKAVITSMILAPNLSIATPPISGINIFGNEYNAYKRLKVN